MPIIRCTMQHDRCMIESTLTAIIASTFMKAALNFDESQAKVAIAISSKPEHKKSSGPMKVDRLWSEYLVTVCTPRTNLDKRGWDFDVQWSALINVVDGNYHQRWSICQIVWNAGWSIDSWILAAGEYRVWTWFVCGRDFDKHSMVRLSENILKGLCSSRLYKYFQNVFLDLMFMG